MKSQLIALGLGAMLVTLPISLGAQREESHNPNWNTYHTRLQAGALRSTFLGTSAIVILKGTPCVA